MSDLNDANCFYSSHEFTYQNEQCEPGWYFLDEEGYPYGPFMDKAHTQRAFILYLKQLEAGVSPTQLRNVPLLKN